MSPDEDELFFIENACPVAAEIRADAGIDVEHQAVGLGAIIGGGNVDVAPIVLGVTDGPIG